ncbi:unnamed protein product, partial [marine sediment metagenome]
MKRQDQLLAHMKAYAVDRASNALLLKHMGVAGESKVVKEKLLAIDPVTKALLVKWVESAPVPTGAEIVAVLEALTGDDKLQAEAIRIIDEGDYFTGTDVEAALQELASEGAVTDRIIDADGDTYVIATEDYIDFYARGVQYARIDVNGLCITEYLRHCGDLDTHLRFTNDRLRVVVGSVDILDITEAATDTVVWNEGGVNVDFRWEGVGVPNAFFIQGSNGKIGIGCADIPHGGVGYAILALEGLQASPDGPHIQITTA